MTASADLPKNEIARRPARRARWQRRPSRLLALLLSSLYAAFAAAQIPVPAPTALPSGGQIRVGAGQIGSTGASMTIDQHSARLGIDWQRFDIGSAAAVEFRQPSASAIALNRVVGNDASAIYGRLSANGQVFLTNPNGVLFAPGAKVDVGGLVASTLDLSQQDFAAGRMTFRDTGSAATLANRGALAAAPGGYLALFGRDVANDGEMTVRAGSVLLASGRAATVAISGNGLLSAVVEPGAAGGVANRGLIDAPGSTVTMTARSAEGVAASLVNNSGIVRANSIALRNGEIWITGDNAATSGTIAADGSGSLSAGSIRVLGGMARGSASIAGTLSAHAGAAGGQGGQVETSAAKVVIADGTRVDTSAGAGRAGIWTIDPTNFDIGVGSGAQTASGIGATTLANNLASGNVTLATAAGGTDPGDINVNAPIAWSANTTLTLTAANNINLNAGITATGNTAGLALNPGSGGTYTLNNGARVTLSGSNPTLAIAGAAYAVVNDVNALQAIGTNAATLAANYALGSDIDASATAGWNGGSGFAPLGTGYYSGYSGRFEGFNHAISGLTVIQPANDYVGLFGSLTNAGVRNLQLAGGSVVGRTYVGALAGVTYGSTAVDNVTSNAQVSASGQNYSTVYAGGLVGQWAAGGTLSNSSASGAVWADSSYSTYAGGLVGYMYSGSIAAGTASGSVTGGPSSSTNNYLGGLVGYFNGGGISDSSASGTVTGAYFGGGLVGEYSGSSAITNSSSSSTVSASVYAGGLVGYLQSGGIATSNASGAVSAGSASSSGYAGGLVGYLWGYYSANAGIDDSFATGNVTGSTSAGGLVGEMGSYYSSSHIANSYATGNVTGGTYAGGLAGYYYSSSGAATAGITQSHASGNVSGSTYVGGLVGQYYGYSPISGSYATGAVSAAGSGTVYAGGLAGYVYGYAGTSPVISQSYASGAVTTTNTGNYYQSTYVGGLAGYLNSSSPASPAIVDAYATSPLSVGSSASYGSTTVGGLVGWAGASLQNTYASGAIGVNAPGTNNKIGGLVGAVYNSATAAASFWATDTTGQSASAIGTGITTAQAQQASTYSGWDVTSAGGGGHTWRVYEGHTAPLLEQFLTPLTLTLANASKTYDGTTSFGNAAIAGVSDPERIYTSASSPNVGSWTITAAGLYSVQNGYDLTANGSATLTVTARPLTLAGVVAGKVYDGTTAATLVAAGQPAGLVPGEQLTINPAGVSAAFDTKNAGTGKTVTISGYTLADGPNGKASNYTLANSTTTTASITPAPLAIGGFSAAARAYDGTTAVAVSLSPAASVTGVIGSDQVRVNVGSLAGTMADKRAGTGKAVTVSGVTLSGADAGDYRIAGIDTVGVDITPKTVTVNGITAPDKVYNASTSTGLNTGSASVAGIVAGDLVTLRTQSIAAATADPNVGTGKALTITGLQLGGPDAANYAPAAAAVTVNITPQPVTVYATGNGSQLNKVYDGTTAAGAVPYTYNNYDGSNLVISYTGDNYSDKNAGNNKTITIGGITLSGSAAGNYTLQNTSATTTGNITPKPLTVSGVTATNRVYDGTPNVNVDVSGAAVDTSGVVSGDTVSVVLPGSGTVVGTMADKNVGTAKPVAVPGLALTGSDASNYSLTSANGVTVTITPKPVTASYSGIDKVYDGTTSARVVASTKDFIGGDNVTFYSNYYWNSGASPYSYANYTGTGAKNVGSGKAITVSTDYLLGNDASNYALNSIAGSATSAAITPKAITPVYNTLSRVYDGTTNASVSANASYSGIYYLDSVSFTQTAAFTGAGAKDVGTGKPIAVSGIAISGADAANYTLASTTASTSGAITPKTVGVTGVAATDRVYNGSTTVAVSASGTVGVNGVLGTDQVGVNLPQGGLTSGTIASKNVGANLPVTVTGLTLSGADAGDYAFDGSGVSVNITQRPLTVSYAGVNKVYNGGAAATVTPSSPDIVSGDVVTFSQTASFVGSGAQNVGTAKPISVTSIAIGGTDAPNYALQNTSATASAAITPRPITVIYAGVNRVYDGVADVSAQVTGSSSQIVAGDAVTFSQSASFTGDGSAGISKPIDVSAITLGGAGAGNYLLNNTTAAASASILPRPIAVTGFSAVNRTYDGTNVVQVKTSGTPSVDTSNLIGGDTISVNLPVGGITTGTMADKNAGSAKAVALSGITLAGSSAANYTVAGSGVSVDIAPLAVTASYAGVDKVYDGGASAAVIASAAGFLAVDAGSVGVAATGTFTGSGAKNVGTAKAVTVANGVLTGVAAADYTLANPSGSTTASITPKLLAAAFSGGARVYDGSVSAPVTGSLSGIVGGDSVGLTDTAVFTGAGAKNVGNAKPVAISGVALTGGDASNYALAATTATTTASVTPKPLTVQGLTGVSAQGRVYDSTATVAVTIASSGAITPTSSDIVTGDQVTINVPAAGQTTGTMADKHVGSHKPVVVTGLSLAGADAMNYTIVGATGVTVDITPKSLSATWVGTSKVYDGTTAATATATSADIYAGDQVSIAGAGVYTGSGAKNVGAGKAISITGGSLIGADAGDYALVNPTGTASADITPRTLVATYSGGTRVYDGTTAAPVTGSLGGLIAGDAVDLSQSAVFTGAGAKNVGTAKPIQVSAIALSGADAGNYTLAANTAAASGSITLRPITLDGLTGIAATNRVYDGTAAVAITVSGTSAPTPHPGDIIAGDAVTVNVPGLGQTTGAMADKNAGQNKPVAVNGLSLSGTDAPNYTLAAAGNVTVTITPKPLTAVYAGVGKVYDGTAAATITGSSADILGGDSVSIGGAAAYTGTGAKNVGTAKTIAITGGSLGGADAGNYALTNPTGSVSADITPLAVTPIYTGGTRVYDGTTAAPVSASTGALVAGDDVAFNQSAVFTGAGAKNVGAAKPVQIGAIALIGSDAGNYALTATSATTTASITPRPIAVSGISGVSATDRVYNGSSVVAVTVSSSGGTPALTSSDLVSGDQVTIAGVINGQTTGTMADKNVGKNKPVLVSGLTLAGADAANYTIASIAGVSVTISPLALTVTGLVPVDRVYDGTAVVAINSSAASASGAIAGDSVQVGASGVTGTMADKNVGNAKPVQAGGVGLTGADAGNYTISAANLSVNIAPRTLDVQAVASSRPYDATTQAQVGFSDDRVAGDRLSVTSASASFADKNAGNGKTVSISGIGLAGADASNYVLSANTASTTANITPASLTITANHQSKVYGDAFGFGGSEFSASGLAGGETIGSVSLTSPGIAAGVPVGSYPIGVSAATGGSFDPSNYALTYVGSQLQVTPRPLSVATNTVVRYVGDTSALTPGFSTSVGALVNGDTIAAATIPLPAGFESAAGGSVYTLQPTAVSFGSGSAANYLVSYPDGLLIVLPKPPALGQAGGGQQNPNNPVFVVSVSPEEVALATQALDTAAAVGAQPPGRPPARRAQPSATAAAAPRGGQAELNLSDLQRQPLITLDPQMRKLIFGRE